MHSFLNLIAALAILTSSRSQAEQAIGLQDRRIFCGRVKALGYKQHPRRGDTLTVSFAEAGAKGYLVAAGVRFESGQVRASLSFVGHVANGTDRSFMLSALEQLKSIRNERRFVCFSLPDKEQVHQISEMHAEAGVTVDAALQRILGYLY